MKKILALVVAMMMVLAVAGSAMAANLGSTGTVTSSETTLTIPKTITVHNTLASGHNVFGPVITLNYTIEPANVASGTTVTGEVVNSNPTANATVYVQAGPNDGVKFVTATTPEKTTATTATLVYNNDAVTSANPTGVAVTKNLTLDVDLTKFGNKAGIYRYKISESNDSAALEALTAAGITRDSEYDYDYYLDVYVNNGNSGLVVEGYVLSHNNETAITSATTSKISKIDDDDFYTYNITLTKNITGTMADKTHKFPFAISVNDNASGTISGTSTSHQIKDYDTVITNVTTSGNNIAAGTFTNTSGFALGNGDTITIYGVSAKGTFTYTETNDTNEVYSVTITNLANTDTNEDANIVNSIKGTSIAKNNGTATTGSLSVSNYSDYQTTSVTATDNSSVTYTNTLDAISPTGVVLRFAPYIIMVGVAAFLLVMAARRKKDTEDKSSAI